MKIGFDWKQFQRRCLNVPEIYIALWQWQTVPDSSIGPFFHTHKSAVYLPFPSKFFLLNYILPNFTTDTLERPELTLS